MTVHLNQAQQSLLAAERTMLTSDSIETCAKMHNVSVRNVGYALELCYISGNAVLEKVERGELSIHLGRRWSRALPKSAHGCIKNLSKTDIIRLLRVLEGK